jgi:hypothetical protein
MLLALALLAAPSPAVTAEVRAAARRPALLKALKKVPGMRYCNRRWVLRRTNSQGDMCRIVLLTLASTTHQAGRRDKNYEAEALARAKLYLDALSRQEMLLKKLTGARRIPNGRWVTALQTSAALCGALSSFATEANGAPLSASKVRAWNGTGLAPGKPLRRLRCQCAAAFDRFAAKLSKRGPLFRETSQSIERQGCAGSGFKAVKNTRFVLPRKQQIDQKASDVSMLANSKKRRAPDRKAALYATLKRHRSVIESCAVDAYRVGGSKAKRAERMKKCICPETKGWRFAPGPAIHLEEEARKGTLILRLGLSERGRVSSCAVRAKQ